MRARTVFVILVSAALAASFANHAFAGLRVNNRTDQNIVDSKLKRNFG
jgi:hypothetical protein